MIRVVCETNYIEFLPEDRVFQLSDYAFDGSVFDIYGALLNGSALVLLHPDQLADAALLAGVIQRQQVTLFFATAALFNTLVDTQLQCLSDVRRILFGGERASVEHTKRALEHLGTGRLINGYGPTETTVFATSHPVETVPHNCISIPIGKPIANTTVYILDACLNPVPVGVNGEICIGGPGVARGYLNRVELTAKTFIHLKPQIHGVRITLYKTGDLGSWMPSGDILFSGRIDHQVKIRGFRIEPGEIENRLLTDDRIRQCRVSTREDRSGERFLCAWFTADEAIDPENLKANLRQSLPEFMIPPYIIQLDRFPLNSSGKVHMAKLPDPRPQSGEEITPPEPGIETTVAKIWSEVLGHDIERIGRDSNFFQMGGHSLKAMLLTSKLHKDLNVSVPLTEIFNRQTLHQLSAYIAEAAAGGFSRVEAVEEREYYPLSTAQKRMYIIQQMDLQSTRYNMPYRIPLEETPDLHRLEDIFHRLMKRHHVFRTSFRMLEENPVQVIHDRVNFRLTDGDPGMGNAFDLGQAPLLRAGVVTADNGSGAVLLVEMHHIISDGTSQEILDRQFNALLDGQELPPLKIQYKDYSQWQNHTFQNRSG